ncbi:MAG: 2-C-methyl-D-erythritol 4-phosphate cytidylyltransferase [Deltaproteobacteria bacterium]|jgi:2-C-methyl-D-erythritol 4-phosphate cytidylyltransferase/2-C-methyl-D-erythritol 2,4-cyclodiphosphate synthase|nr:2-C-methyl-D-erythritol 4-phosphate cytidylyltransferase [Deltaproteobacteria bacterium]
MEQFFTSAVIVAAGRGLRFDRGEGGPPKQLRPLGGRPVVARTVEAFRRHPRVNEVILVAPAESSRPFEELCGLWPEVRLAAGGERRLDSVRRGFEAVSPQAQVVLIHDGARPLVAASEIDAVRTAAWRDGAAALAVPINDTVKRADALGFVAGTVDRAGLWRAQTPQGFRVEILAQALARPEPATVTDEAALVEALGRPVRLVPGSPTNLKITDPEDLALAERLLTPPDAGFEALRVGQGWDFHRFDPQKPLWLGCVLLPGEIGLAGWSDADVLAHALIDALLGAAGLGDVGAHFPPGDERWRGASGAELLKLAFAAVQAAGWRLINADLALFGERPRVSDHRTAMLKALSAALGEDESRFNLKGKTTEGLGFLGRREGLAAAATAFLGRLETPGGVAPQP